MNLIRELRKAKGLSQEDLARLLHVTQTAVSHWETGKNMPDAQQSIALAKILNISVDYLLTGEQPVISDTPPGTIKNTPDLKAEGEKRELLNVISSLSQEEAKKLLEHAQLLLKARAAQE